MDNKILLEFNNYIFKMYGFENYIDSKRNIYYKQTINNNIFIVWPGIRDEQYWGCSASIVFSDLQVKYTNLCSAAITRNNKFVVTNEWLGENYSNPSINSNVKVDTPNGVIISKFYGLTLQDYLQDSAINSINDKDTYIGYLEEYMTNSALIFFKDVNNGIKLNSITNNVNKYELGLYLTGIPPLKKIVLMGIVEDTTITEYISNYENTLKSISRNVVIDSILTSLTNIKSYFDVRC